MIALTIILQWIAALFTNLEEYISLQFSHFTKKYCQLSAIFQTF